MASASKAAPKMTAPVAVLPNPGEPDQVWHLLYTLSDNAQIGLERRSTNKKDRRVSYVDNGNSQGSIKNPGAFAGIIQDNLPVVYGIAKSGKKGSETDNISRLSPYYNPIADSDGNLFATDHKAVAACTEPTGDDGPKYYVYFLQKIESSSQYQLIELNVDINEAVATPYPAVQPGEDSNLACFSFENSRWIFWVDGAYIWYISSSQPKGVMDIKTTYGVSADSPLAVTSFRSRDNENNSLLRIVLYYVNGDHTLLRCTGQIKNDRLDMSAPTPVPTPKPVNQFSSLAALGNKDDTNAVYYIPESNIKYEYEVYMDHPWIGATSA